MSVPNNNGRSVPEDAAPWDAWEAAKHEGNLTRQAECCRNLAAWHRDQGDHSGADRFLQLALRAEMNAWQSIECGLSSDQLLHLSTSAAIGLESGRAFALCRIARLQPAARQDDIHRQLAALELRFGLLHAARNELIDALKAAGEAGDAVSAAEVLESLGHVERAGDRVEDSVLFYRAAAGRFSEINEPARAQRAEAWLREARVTSRLVDVDPGVN